MPPPPPPLGAPAGASMPFQRVKLHLLYGTKAKALAAQSAVVLPSGVTVIQPMVVSPFEIAPLWELYAHVQFTKQADRDAFASSAVDALGASRAPLPGSSVMRWISHDDETGAGAVSRDSLTTAVR